MEFKFGQRGRIKRELQQVREMLGTHPQDAELIVRRDSLQEKLTDASERVVDQKLARGSRVRSMSPSQLERQHQQYLLESTRSSIALLRSQIADTKRFSETQRIGLSSILEDMLRKEQQLTAALGLENSSQ